MNKSRRNLSPKKKAEIEERAQWAIEDYVNENELIVPELIARAEGISYTFNDYNSNFEGLIECSGKQFHIYLNIGSNQNLNSPQVRFSFAHELGHYFIDEHRWELMNSGFLAYIPDIPMLSQPVFEKEADFFASCLLMPRSRILNFIDADAFSIDMILQICTKFQVSLSAALSRYMALGNIPIMVVYTYNDGTFDYHLKSRNFPFYKLNLSANNMVPGASKAWECCLTNWNDYTSPKVNLANVWFQPKKEIDVLRSFCEYCFQQPSIGKVMSVIWEVES